MTATIQTLPLLVAVLVVVAIVARRFNIAPPILPVIAGILLALTPGLPRIELAPELVLLGILPPLRERKAELAARSEALKVAQRAA
jgi:monovalent cation/hydrogen antiporter